MPAILPGSWQTHGLYDAYGVPFSLINPLPVSLTGVGASALNPAYVSGTIGVGQTILYAQGSGASADVVAAVTGKQIVVINYFIQVDTAGASAKFQSDASVDLTPAAPLAQYGGRVEAGSTLSPLFTTAVGKKLNIVVSAGNAYWRVAYYTV